MIKTKVNGNLEKISAIKLIHNNSLVSIAKILTKVNNEMVTIFSSASDIVVQGVPPLSFSTTLAGYLKNYQIFGNSIQTHNLPSGYQEVEYIQSTGAQYIDVGLTMSTNLDMECEILFPTVPTSTWYFMASAGENDRITWLGATTSSTVWYAGSAVNNTGMASVNFSINANTKYKFKTKLSEGKVVFTINGVEKINATRKNLTLSRNVVLFKRDNTSTYVSCILYSCKIWQNGTLARHYIPCYRKNDISIGLYDLVNNVFYPNKGSGSFGKGADSIPSVSNPVEIQSVGDKTANLLPTEDISIGVNDYYPIDIPSGITFCMSADNSGCNANFYDETKTNIYARGMTSTGGGRYYRNGTPSFDIKWVRFTGTIPQRPTLQLGSAFYTYVHAGYSVPIIMNNETNVYYLEQPLRKIGDVSDYIDWKSQKIIRNIAEIKEYNGEVITTNYISSTGSLTTGATVIYVLTTPTEENITLPQLSFVSGVNVFNVDTSVTSSNVKLIY